MLTKMEMTIKIWFLKQLKAKIMRGVQVYSQFQRISISCFFKSNQENSWLLPDSRVPKALSFFIPKKKTEPLLSSCCSYPQLSESLACKSPSDKHRVAPYCSLPSAAPSKYQQLPESQTTKHLPGEKAFHFHFHLKVHQSQI